MKKLVSLILAMLLVFGCFALAESDINTIAGRNAAIGYPVVDEPVELDILLVPQDAAIDFKPENNWLCQWIDRYSGLKINWTVIDPTSARERVSMILNSGDMPDAILGNAVDRSGIVQYGVVDGLFMPLNDLIVQYCPTLNAFLESDPQAKRDITASDGNIYGFPSFANIWSYKNRVFINQDWLNNVGMSNPTTLAELKDVLVAFRDQDANGNGDPSDEIPWSGSWSEGFSERQVVLYALGLISGDGVSLYYADGDSSVVYTPYTDVYKDFLLYMNDLWNEKLLDADMFTQTEMQVQANVLEGIVGISPMSAPYVYDPNNKEAWVSINAIAKDSETTAVWPGPQKLQGISELLINADCSEEKAVALAKWADCFYKLEWYSMATYGPESGTEMDWNNHGHYYDETIDNFVIDTPSDMPSMWNDMCTYITFWAMPGFQMVGYDPYMTPWGILYPETAYGKMYANGPKGDTWECIHQATYSPYYVPDLPEFMFASEDQNRVNELLVPLNDYVASMEAKFITGEISIEDDFENFRATLESYGVKELMDIYSRYYAAYMAG